MKAQISGISREVAKMGGRRLGRRLCIAWLAAAGTLLWGWPVALADVPAVTDFGQDTVTPAAATEPTEGLHRALFVTWHADGHAELVERWIRDDAIAGFAGTHPAWQRNEALCWWFQLPVYERTLMTVPESAERWSL